MRGEEKAITTWAFFFRSGTRPVSSLQSSPPVFSSHFWSPPFLFGFTALFVCFVTDKHAVKTGGSASLCQRMEHTKRRVAYKCVCIVFLFNHGCAFVFEKEQLLPSFFSRQRIPLLLFLLLPSFFDTQAVECTYGDYTTVFQMFFLCECKVRENAGHPHRAQLLFKGFAARNEWKDRCNAVLQKAPTFLSPSFFSSSCFVERMCAPKKKELYDSSPSLTVLCVCVCDDSFSFPFSCFVFNTLKTSFCLPFLYLLRKRKSVSSFSF